MAMASASMAMAATSGVFSARCCADPKSVLTSAASSTNSVKISSSTSLGHLRTSGPESVSVDTGRHAVLDPALQHANLMWFRGAYNAQIFVSEDENADSIVRRFRKAVMQAGVIPECRRRRYFETPQDIAKRKLLASHRRNKSRRFTPNREPAFGEKKEGGGVAKAAVDDDYWGYTPETS